ncbi:uncharacterized protein LOC117109070 [Anneissia japonica]|uniref:uncharacterized protein LOC117109070 n=1 Tax=Anneissia japonica TaxID=1529436 RepID=UPI0014258057|nr:uncharacterized protein LOC117109070 [Anneissia japonica]
MKMAESTAISKSDNCRDVCVCNICANEYDEGDYVPKVLPCSHTICLLCVNKLIVGGSLSCPECRQKHPVPKAPSTLPTNRIVYEMMEAVKDNSIGTTVNLVCDRCVRPEWKRKATGWCCTCREYMCHLCERHHRVEKVSANHNIKIFHQANASSEYYCDYHKSEILCRVCLSCGLQILCEKCDGHRPNGHNVVTFNEFDIESLSDQMRQQASMIQGFQTIAVTNKQRQSSAYKKYFDSIEDSKTSVQSHTEKMIEVLRDKEKYLLQQLDNMKIIGGKELKNSDGKFHNILDSIEEVMSVGFHPVEMIRAHKQYELFIQDFPKTHNVTPSRPSYNFLEFVPGNVHEFQNSLQNFGSFQKDCVAPENTEVRIKTGVLHSRSQCRVNLRRMDKTAASNINNVSVLKAQVLHNKNLLKDTVISNLGGGRFSVSYTPHNLSNHQIKVWAFDNLVCDEVIPIVEISVKNLVPSINLANEFNVTIEQRCFNNIFGDNGEGRFNPWPEFEVVCRNQDESKLETKKLESFIDTEIFTCIPNKVGVVSVNVYHEAKPLPLCQKEMLVFQKSIEVGENLCCQDFAVLPTGEFAVVCFSAHTSGQLCLLKYDENGSFIKRCAMSRQPKEVTKISMTCDFESNLYVLFCDKNNNCSIDVYSKNLQFKENNPYQSHVDEYEDLHLCFLKLNLKHEMILSDADSACFWVLGKEGTLQKKVTPHGAKQEDINVGHFCMDKENKIVFCDRQQGKVHYIDEEGNIVWTIHRLQAPSLVAVNDDSVAIFIQDHILIIKKDSLEIKLKIPCKFNIFQMSLCKNDGLMISDRDMNCIMKVN